jgi:type II secretory pathway component GspD/PulD (secretin)
MLSTRHRIFLALALALVAASSASAQTEQNAQKQEDNFVTQKMFQNRVFEIKNRDPLSLARVLSPLTSGFRGAVVSPNQEFRTISVRDFPENIAVIEEAIRHLDQPEPVHPGIEFHIHMLVASNDEAGSSRYPAELADVVKQLQSTLGYKNFNLMGSQIVRSKEGHSDNSNRGVADLRLANDTPASKNPIFYNYNIRTVSLDSVGGQARVQIEEFNMDMKVPVSLGPFGADKISYESVGFKNPVSLREGEKVVVGTTNIADKSVIVILSASAMK